MAKKNREKNFWFVPKRANVHQMIALLHSIIKRDYDGTTWNAQKQDNLNLEMKRLGATQSGQKIAPQGMRTLLASVHYLGFVYLDNTTTPTTLKVTEAGYKFYNQHKEQLKPLKRLKKDETINQSTSILEQMTKLQITNPIILPHCEDIFIFPFRAVLTLMKELEYLDKEEIALYVFHIRALDEINLIIEQIKNFRALTLERRKVLIEAYKLTEVGNITLTKASSAGYFMQLCEGTGIINRKSRNIQIVSETDGDIEIHIDSIMVYSNRQKEVDNILDLYKDIKTYDFEDQLHLWIEYFGNPKRLYPPNDILIKNFANKELYVEVINLYGTLIDTDILLDRGELIVPMFENNEYSVLAYDAETSIKVFEEKLIIERNQIQIDLFDNIKAQQNIEDVPCSQKLYVREPVVPYNSDFYKYTNKIMEHSKSKDFTNEVKIKLRLLQAKLGIDKLNDKSLRGAYYELFFYQMLSRLKEFDIIEDVYWNGKVGKYTLPVQAPGGKEGNPDLIFRLMGVDYVLELTTIKSKSGQFNAELSSVPDHIKRYQLATNRKVRGVFCAPIIHERNNAVMKAILDDANVQFISIKDSDLISIFETMDRGKVLDALNKLFNK